MYTDCIIAKLVCDDYINYYITVYQIIILYCTLQSLLSNRVSERYTGVEPWLSDQLVTDFTQCILVLDHLQRLPLTLLECWGLNRDSGSLSTYTNLEHL